MNYQQYLVNIYVDNTKYCEKTDGLLKTEKFLKLFTKFSTATKVKKIEEFLRFSHINTLYYYDY